MNVGIGGASNSGALRRSYEMGKAISYGIVYEYRIKPSTVCYLYTAYTAMSLCTGIII